MPRCIVCSQRSQEVSAEKGGGCGLGSWKGPSERWLVGVGGHVSSRGQKDLVIHQSWVMLAGGQSLALMHARPCAKSSTHVNSDSPHSPVS